MVDGDRTRAAVIAFQHANALELNGELDDNTKKALAHIYEGTRSYLSQSLSPSR